MLFFLLDRYNKHHTANVTSASDGRTIEKSHFFIGKLHK